MPMRTSSRRCLVCMGLAALACSSKESATSNASSFGVRENPGISVPSCGTGDEFSIVTSAEDYERRALVAFRTCGSGPLPDVRAAHREFDFSKEAVVSLQHHYGTGMAAARYVYSMPNDGTLRVTPVITTPDGPLTPDIATFAHSFAVTKSRVQRVELMLQGKLRTLNTTQPIPPPVTVYEVPSLTRWTWTDPYSDHYLLVSSLDELKDAFVTMFGRHNPEHTVQPFLARLEDQRIDFARDTLVLVQQTGPGPTPQASLALAEPIDGVVTVKITVAPPEQHSRGTQSLRYAFVVPKAVRRVDVLVNGAKTASLPR